MNTHVMYRRVQGNTPPLSDDQIRQFAPSVFAPSRHTATSERYQFISTAKVLQALRAEGFLPIRALQTNVRLSDRKEYTRHLLVFRPMSGQCSLVDDLLPEIVLLNAHDGTSSYQVHAGLFRVICSNGLIVSDATFASIKVKHCGSNVVDDVIEGTYEVVKATPALMGTVEEWRSIALTDQQRLAYAKAALHVRWKEDDAPIMPAQLVAPRRDDDKTNDLFTTYNVVQENIVNGGVRGKTQTGKRTKTRGMNSVTENVRLNKALWTLTEEMANLAR